MDTIPTQPMSRRDVWLTVALAVAKGQIAQPTDFEVLDDIKVVDLVYNAKGDDPLAIEHAAEAAAFLGLGEPSAQPGIRTWWDIKDGWHWNVRAYFERDEQAATPGLASQVVEAIGAANPLITDPVELAAAYGIAWPADACPSCGGRLVDGVCQGGENCDDPTCTRACCANRRQGAVAVQRPGFGAS